MNKDELRWHIFPRDVLPEFLVGFNKIFRAGQYSIHPYDVSGDNVAIGYSNAEISDIYSPPCLMVVGREAAAETLSWLKVYAPEVFPLSQYVRVVSIDEWVRFGENKRFKGYAREDIWASVVLGEAIAQGEADVEVNALPLSRAGACFSMAMARVACTHGTDDATSACADRLRQVEADKRFVRRTVSVADLLPIWAMAHSRFGDSVSVQDTVDLVLEAALDFMPRESKRFSSSGLRSLRSIPEISSDSIETRVLAFQRLIMDLSYAEDKNNGAFSSILVAAAAFLVGRSTSHEFLLRRVGRQFPSAPAWYGLIAALAGPASWDASWARAAKGIERQIRSRFDWSEYSGFDLSWAEYDWLASTFDGGELFASLPKLMPRILSIEILPGSTCQFRLVGSGPAEASSRSSFDFARERELQTALSEFIALANRTRGLLGAGSATEQLALSLDVPAKYPRASKPKKGKTSSG